MTVPTFFIVTTNSPTPPALNSDGPTSETSKAGPAGGDVDNDATLGIVALGVAVASLSPDGTAPDGTAIGTGVDSF